MNAVHYKELRAPVIILWHDACTRPRESPPMKKMTTTGRAVASDVLLLGALYALEQCGLLLNDAAALIEQRRYPTAAAIALFAFEELGRHKMLLKFWRKSVGGVSINREEVNGAFKEKGSHVKKQREASTSLSYRMEPGDQMNQFLQARQKATPGSDEWRAADEKVHLVDKHRFKQQPDERHTTRKRAIYVDLGDDDTWLRPSDLMPQVCADEVQTALNDYRSAKLRVEEAASIHQDSQLADAVNALVNRPTLRETPLISIAAGLPSSGGSGPCR
jgi:AbiV family abortive infection protein